MAKCRSKKAKDIEELKVVKVLGSSRRKYYKELMNDGEKEIEEKRVKFLAEEAKEIEIALRKMGEGRALGPDNIPI